VDHTCNPDYSGGTDLENQASLGKKYSWDHHLLIRRGNAVLVIPATREVNRRILGRAGEKK
jgi:hypothetical protein